jgi:hypothetical protein
LEWILGGWGLAETLSKMGHRREDNRDLLRETCWEMLIQSKSNYVDSYRCVRIG